MINLIPNEEKKRKVRDFYLRLAAVFLTVLGFATIIASVAILPSYLLSNIKKNVITEKLTEQKNAPVPQSDQENLNALSDLNNKLKIIDDTEKIKYLVTQAVLSEIILKKMPDIKITDINYNAQLSGVKAVTVSGIAPSRARLLLFRDALQTDPAFKKVDLPISNFIKGADINFSLSVTPL